MYIETIFYIYSHTQLGRNMPYKDEKRNYSANKDVRRVHRDRLRLRGTTDAYDIDYTQCEDDDTQNEVAFTWTERTIMQ